VVAAICRDFRKRFGEAKMGKPEYQRRTHCCSGTPVRQLKKVGGVRQATIDEGKDTQRGAPSLTTIGHGWFKKAGLPSFSFAGPWASGEKGSPVSTC
jgi:hypothetical protein